MYRNITKTNNPTQAKCDLRRVCDEWLKGKETSCLYVRYISRPNKEITSAKMFSSHRQVNNVSPPQSSYLETQAARCKVQLGLLSALSLFLSLARKASLQGSEANKIQDKLQAMWCFGHTPRKQTVTAIYVTDTSKILSDMTVKAFLWLRILSYFRI